MWTHTLRLETDSGDGNILMSLFVWTHSLYTVRESQILKLCIDQGQIRTGRSLQMPGRVGGPYIMKPPQNQTVVAGQRVELHCETEAYPSQVEHTWFKNGIDVATTRGFHSNRITKRNDGSLLLVTVVKADDGWYKCRARNSLGQDEASAYLNVTYLPIVQDMPSRVIWAKGYMQHLDCPADANPPVLGANWTKNDAPVRSTGRTDILTNGTLIVSNVQESDAGLYQCRPYNQMGQGEYSTRVQVQVKDPPYFVVSPDILYVANVGETVKIPCQATGIPDVTIQWIKVGDLLDRTSGRISITNTYIEIKNVTKRDHGRYECRAVNTIATVVKVTSLRVDQTSPHAPFNVTVIPQAFNVTVTWEPAHDGGTPQQYSLWFRRSNQADWNVMKVYPPSATHNTLYQLMPDTEYEFKVVATNTLGNSSFSETVRQKTLGYDPNTVNALPTYPNGSVYYPTIKHNIGIQPSPPRNLTAHVNGHDITLNWDSPRNSPVPYFSFQIEYFRGTKWIRLDSIIKGEQARGAVINDMPSGTYNLRLLSCGVMACSGGSNVVRISVSDDDLVLPEALVGGIVGGILFLLVAILLALVAIFHSRKKDRKSKNKKYNDVTYGKPDKVNGRYHERSTKWDRWSNQHGRGDIVTSLSNTDSIFFTPKSREIHSEQQQQQLQNTHHHHGQHHHQQQQRPHLLDNEQITREVYRGTEQQQRAVRCSSGDVNSDNDGAGLSGNPIQTHERPSHNDFNLVQNVLHDHSDSVPPTGVKKRKKKKKKKKQKKEGIDSYSSDVFKHPQNSLRHGAIQGQPLQLHPGSRDDEGAPEISFQSDLSLAGSFRSPTRRSYDPRIHDSNQHPADQTLPVLTDGSCQHLGKVEGQSAPVAGSTGVFPSASVRGPGHLNTDGFARRSSNDRGDPFPSQGSFPDAAVDGPYPKLHNNEHKFSDNSKLLSSSSSYLPSHIPSHYVFEQQSNQQPGNYSSPTLAHLQRDPSQSHSTHHDPSSELQHMSSPHQQLSKYSIDQDQEDEVFTRNPAVDYPPWNSSQVSNNQEHPLARIPRHSSLKPGPRKTYLTEESLQPYHSATGQNPNDSSQLFTLENISSVLDPESEPPSQLKEAASNSFASQPFLSSAGGQNYMLPNTSFERNEGAIMKNHAGAPNQDLYANSSFDARKQTGKVNPLQQQLAGENSTTSTLSSGRPLGYTRDHLQGVLQRLREAPHPRSRSEERPKSHQIPYSRSRSEGPLQSRQSNPGKIVGGANFTHCVQDGKGKMQDVNSHMYGTQPLISNTFQERAYPSRSASNKQHGNFYSPQYYTDHKMMGPFSSEHGGTSYPGVLSVNNGRFGRVNTENSVTRMEPDTNRNVYQNLQYAPDYSTGGYYKAHLKTPLVNTYDVRDENPYRNLPQAQSSNNRLHNAAQGEEFHQRPRAHSEGSRDMWRLDTDHLTSDANDNMNRGVSYPELSLSRKNIHPGQDDLSYRNGQPMGIRHPVQDGLPYHPQDEHHSGSAPHLQRYGGESNSSAQRNLQQPNYTTKSSVTYPSGWQGAIESSNAAPFRYTEVPNQHLLPYQSSSSSGIGSRNTSQSTGSLQQFHQTPSYFNDPVEPNNSATIRLRNRGIKSGVKSTASSSNTKSSVSLSSVHTCDADLSSDTSFGGHIRGPQIRRNGQSQNSFLQGLPSDQRYLSHDVHRRDTSGDENYEFDSINALENDIMDDLRRYSRLAGGGAAAGTGGDSKVPVHPQSIQALPQQSYLSVPSSNRKSNLYYPTTPQHGDNQHKLPIHQQQQHPPHSDFTQQQFERLREEFKAYRTQKKDNSRYDRGSEDDSVDGLMYPPTAGAALPIGVDGEPLYPMDSEML
ncbi:protein turtle [Plakobranchus ocellatus]|uniref:Protein turtle n=1 Tax=Plakobranchus ocellatus TaxID=259542 RepID=A0AAV4AU47_9GAST|nr:protein turtle [Plakobranchus ocellatus]